MRIRASVVSDRPFLDEMLFDAFFWKADVARPTLSRFREEPAFASIFDAWGRPGDRALIATADDLRLGAAWFRLWTPELHSYGFVAADTPEIGMAVAATHRSRGIGRALLRALIETARADGHPALSLSVSPDNPARGLYESEGFRKVGESGTSWTMLRGLEGRDGLLLPRNSNSNR